MISRRQIERMARSRSWGVLAERILANGRCLGEKGRERLCRPAGASAAGLGLALQRLAELTYGPDPLGDVLMERLCAEQRDDGLFGAGYQPSPAASAAALKGLMVWADRQAENGRACGGRTIESIHRGLAELSTRLDRMADAFIDEVDLAVILWQLADRPAFRRAVNLEALINRLHCPNGAMSETDDELARCARAMAA
ncbi:MAG: hypothetical protein JSV91_02810 [Phycisphaerales bacterium]|nr:MAG: hypothetical protein JSV91_02810 [Phycisphaerales bacterium]